LRKFGQYIFYFFSSLKNRGVFFTFRLMYNEWKWEKKLGISTLQIENPSFGERTQEFHHYQGASYFVMREMFARLPAETKRGAFLDIGCGKGRVMIVAAMNGFKKVSGLDLSSSLLRQAKCNTEKCRLNLSATDFVFIEHNAEEFNLPDDVTLVFLFNPFGEAVMEKVVKCCNNSLSVKPRQLFVLYLNPKYQLPWINGGFKVLDVFRSKNYEEAVLFCSIS
jgi:SAM-dependent methyltransferase